MQLVSLTAGVPLEDLCTHGRAIHLVWPTFGAPNAKPVHIQVESLKPALDYRLNANRPARSFSYEWPPEPRCNEDVKLRGSELALIARTESSIGSSTNDVLLPVALSVQAAERVRPPYRAVLRHERRIREVFVSLWYYEEPARPVEIMLDRPLGLRPYPASGQVTVELSEASVNKRGLYRLIISVEFENAPTDAIEKYFFAE